MSIRTETVQIQTPHGTMPIYAAYPENSPGPGLLLLQEAFGVNDHIKDVASRFAKEGYSVAAPELYYRTAPPGFSGPYEDFTSLRPHFSVLTPENLESDLKVSYEWLSSNPNVISERIGSIGYCLGGWASFVANAVIPVRAAVSFYGSAIAPTAEKYSPLQKSPLLLVWGGKDRSVKAEHRRSVADLLKSSEKNFTEILFSNAQHGFFCDARAAYDAPSARQAWSLTLAFLKEYV
ncbi:dienelactone hydrolase family protein [Leptospira wolffii]|uniref:Dienelactone hydrolase family protein n=1 Tax=Leptospira wolffii TaxID=409998 RepID=A0ABV5BV60_9LEPT|nr:dienelactone hydrolase family protein [Leptospira wolffii]EPG66148.1 dienelactone hydrolase family protein [Leptospira wolffii serovar Khorat str. Khorat-H2]